MDYNKIFEEQFWPLNTIGKKNHSKTDAFLVFRGACLNNDLNPDFLISKYKDYIAYIDKLNFDREPRYRTKPMSIQEWLEAKKWEEDYSIVDEKDPLDSYLYGYLNDEK